MATIVTRVGKGSALSIAEADANFTNLNSGKLETNGDGSAVTNLNGSNIATGTVPLARLPVGSVSVAGVVQLENTGTSTSPSLAATAKSVSDANSNALALAIALG